ncbi:hypothetical protein ACFWIJ_29295 [Streptomyces sp. NPDC127079]|uniref:hypothetical protein n=1 Tax=Streptomyces sp. NPDC127079 TaxID=3347132 RepID=UPI0036565767
MTTACGSVGADARGKPTAVAKAPPSHSAAALEALKKRGIDDDDEFGVPQKL